jgi:hypothetical protein
VLVRPKAVSTLRASVRFAAALCEISGDFLIFVRLHTVGVSFSGRTAQALAPCATSIDSCSPFPSRSPASPFCWGYTVCSKQRASRHATLAAIGDYSLR